MSAVLLPIILLFWSLSFVNAQTVSFLSGFEPPELDGFPVDPCAIAIQLPAPQADHSGPAVTMATNDPALSTTKTKTLTTTIKNAPPKPGVQSEPQNNPPIRGFVHHIQLTGSSSESDEIHPVVNTASRTNQNTNKPSLSSEESDE